jgi:serine/threonine protein kinase
MNDPATTDPGRNAIVIGRYLLHRQIARGGMATIHIARLVGDEGFTRIVAAKRLHPEFAEDRDFVSMFLDEARIASKVHHRNVVPVLDVVTTGEEVVLVQEYVHGVPLHWLLRTAHEAKTHVPINIAVSIGCQVLAGLQAAHETTDEMGEALGVVHRDVSPQNIMVATDGTARLLDFGIAKATMAAHITREGMFKGKLAYSAPEQIRGAATQQSDIYSLSVVLWELLVGHRLHNNAQSEGELIAEVMTGRLPTILEVLAPEKEWLGANRWRHLEALDQILQRGLHIDVSKRWKTAAEMEAALASAVSPASTTGVAGWLKTLGREFLTGRDRVIALEEASWRRNSAAVPRRVSQAGTTPNNTEPGTIPAAPAPLMTRYRGRILAAAAVGMFMVILAFIIWITRDPVVEVAAAPALSFGPIAPPPQPAASPAIRNISAAAGSAVAPEKTVLRPAPINNIARNRIPPRPVQRIAPREVVPPPKPVAVAPAPPPAAPALDCNPPYFYDGAKKVFKPACI